ncbi:MAG TPA: hypothetical protein VFX98_18925 [Longimicrobiaceae bacterium]|nr:hypothetical protein [Longimicrobiaceae bacterium]
MKKLRLNLETLAVDSFETSREGSEPGTVLAQESIDPTPPEYQPACTYFNSCLCKTAYYHCGTGPHTIHSCNFTFDATCNTEDARCTRWC